MTRAEEIFIKNCMDILMHDIWKHTGSDGSSCDNSDLHVPERFTKIECRCEMGEHLAPTSWRHMTKAKRTTIYALPPKCRNHNMGITHASCIRVVAAA